MAPQKKNTGGPKATVRDLLIGAGVTVALVLFMYYFITDYQDPQTVKPNTISNDSIVNDSLKKAIAFQNALQAPKNAK